MRFQDPGSECPRPQCAEPTGFGAVKQGGARAGEAAAAPAAAAPGAAGAAPGAATAAVGAAAGAAQLRLLRKREVSNEAILDVRAEINAIEITDQVRRVFLLLDCSRKISTLVPGLPTSFAPFAQSSRPRQRSLRLVRVLVPALVCRLHRSWYSFGHGPLRLRLLLCTTPLQGMNTSP